MKHINYLLTLMCLSAFADMAPLIEQIKETQQSADWAERYTGMYCLSKLMEHGKGIDYAQELIMHIVGNKQSIPIESA